MEKKLGKISQVSFGLGGYQNCQLGLLLTFQGKDRFQGKDQCSNKDNNLDCDWDCDTFIGNWDPQSIKHHQSSKWTEKDRSKSHDNLLRFLSKLLNQAKVDSVDQLKNIPVELSFDNNVLKNWRILEEVL